MSTLADAVDAPSYSLGPFEVDGILYDRGAVVAESWARPEMVELRPDGACYCTREVTYFEGSCYSTAAYSWRKGDWVFPGGAA